MGKARILIVDDEPDVLGFMQQLLEQKGYEVESAAGGAQALLLLAEKAPALLITDLRMPQMSGIELLGRIREQNRGLPCVVLTAAGDTASAVQAMRAGAADYLIKPIDVATLLLSVERALERRDLQVDAENLRRQLNARNQEGLAGLLGTSLPMQRVYRMARQVAPARATVLLTGESGTGKGLVARVIHGLSPRKSAPFVSLDCAALAERLLESELFGHEKGAFNGAEQRRVGRFEQAHGGTLFLDEIAEIPMATQLKLLRMLQERTLERVGGNDSIPIDVRLIAATSKDLPGEVRERRFREDLYYRLNVAHIEMPPLRLRGHDVIVLAEHFLQKFARENQRPIDGLSEAARAKILAHGWPGNVRELENAMERAVVFSDGPLVEVEALPFNSTPAGFGDIIIPGASLAEIERYAITKTLEAVGGSNVRAAEILDVSVRTIQYRLHEYGTSADGKPSSGHSPRNFCAAQFLRRAISAPRNFCAAQFCAPARSGNDHHVGQFAYFAVHAMELRSTFAMVKRDHLQKRELASRAALTAELLRLREAEQRLSRENEELLEAQQLLEDARDDFAELYDGAPLPLLTLGMRGAIRSANLATAELFERERSWLLGRSFRILFHDLDRSRLAACLSASGGLKECQTRLILPNETLVPVSLSRRFSLRKPGITHVTLVDMRASLGTLISHPNDTEQTHVRRRILLVEDHLDTAEAMQEVLERNGYRVVSADSVEAAVAVDLTRVDAIVSDIVLPDGMGTDLLRQLKQERDVPAIAFSGLTRRADIERAKQAGFELYFTKPVDFPRLLKALGTMLDAAAPTNNLLA